MGSCLSKKKTTAAATATSPTPPPPEEPQKPKSKVAVESNVVKKEVFIIKHRSSHERSLSRSEEERSDSKKSLEKDVEIAKAPSSNSGSENPNFNGTTPSAAVRTSSCTKEEVDAILIQCGRLSRSSSAGKAHALSSDGGGSRKYAGSKRSYDFESEDPTDGNAKDEDGVDMERENRRRERSRSHSRRRTPSRERDGGGSSGNHQQRSGKSRERGSSNSTGTARRVSRSPGRRSESPAPVAALNGGGGGGGNMPGKMVSVPATDKSGSNNTCGEGNNTTPGVKRIQVKRNVGGNKDSRTGTSPRARSPARVRVSGLGQAPNTGPGQAPNSTLSRSNSRKAEQSPCRRNPLGEIDTNIIASQKPGLEHKINSSNIPEKVNVISSGNEGLITRNRSKRLSRDLDAPDTSSYTALLLEDIQNFHQKNNNAPPSFSLPACVAKARSILEAVADLNSSTNSNNILEDRRRNPVPELQMSSSDKNADEPFIESEVVVGPGDDLMQPSFEKYVTMKRGGGEDLEELESSGSNSYVGSHQQQHWMLSSSCSSWEPNSVESTGNWTTGPRSISPLGFERSSVVLESGKNVVDERGKKMAAVKHQQNGIGRGRIGSKGSK